MKGNIKLLGISVMATLIIVVAALYVTGFSWFSTGAIVTDGGCTLVKPEFGRMVCEPISHSKSKLVEETLSYGQDYGGRALWRFECGDNENSPSCDFYARCDCNPSDPKCDFYYQISDDSRCKIGSDGWCNQGLTGGQESVFKMNKPRGTVVQIGSCKGGLGTLYAGEAGTYSIPYGLNVYEFGGAFRYNTRSCSLSDWGLSNKNDVAVNCGGVEGCTNEYTGDFIEFDDWVNYLASWNYVVEGLDSRYIEDYNGKEAYCIAGQIWELGEFDTMGACYTVQKRVIAHEECCPGMRAGSQICGDDFKYHTQSSGEVECYTDLECYVSTSTGTQYIPDYSTPDLDIVRWECISNTCEITDRKAVQCVPPNIGCTDGQVCNPNKGYICENQVGPGIVCGDGVCSSPYEDILNCPQDCTNPNEWDMNFLIIIILAAAGLFMGRAISGSWTWGGAGAAVGGLIGFAIYWFLNLAWWQQALLGIGGIAGGGLTMYLFGGSIIAFLVLIVALKKGGD